ncbi:ABC transporter ATP-binding protein [Flaviflagellibacter deserti]|uniref:ABC transporter ATP-binding protein n=1 Tax=Flaviflagellibacter deserti TaxID=2267266 RepID=A0ABV9Z2R0_9HYPH
MIDIRNVSLSHGGTRVLDDISLTVPKGGVTALVGPNGAGKSSLLSLIARLQPLQDGQITVDGLPVGKTPSRQLAKTLAVLRQDPAIGSRLRVGELVALGRFPHHRGRPGPEDRRIVAETLDEFDLATLADKFVETLSGGQRQRVLVAMTFCQGTDYVLLDEPLNNLDMYHARQLMRYVRRVADEKTRTIVIIVHEINYAAAYADHIVAMKSGRLEAHGPTAEVLGPAMLKQVFGYEMSVLKGQSPLVAHY